MLEPGLDLIEGLKARYSEPQRHYHTWQHIEALLRHFDGIADALNNPTAVLWALYWHDAIYDPHAPDNEDKSAELMIDAARTELDVNSLELAEKIIRATKKHQIPEGLSPTDADDLALFLDVDLSILGADNAVFDGYECQIRDEYAFVPLELYRQARGGILKGFLNRERLYFTDHFHDLWETQARANLTRSIETLERGDSAHV